MPNIQLPNPQGPLKPEGFKHGELSRRTALLGIAGVVLAPALVQTSVVHASPTELALILDEATAPAFFYDQNFARKTIWPIAQSVRVNAQQVSSVLLTFVFDKRILSLSDRLVVRIDNTVTTLAPVGDTESGHVRSVDYELRIGGNASLDASIVMPLQPGNLYPNDLVPSASIPNVRAKARHLDGTTTDAQVTIEPAFQSGTLPAALTLSGSWDTVAASSSTAALVYRAPTVIMIHNDGPGEATTFVELTSDPRFCGEPSLWMKDGDGLASEVEVTHTLESGVRISSTSALLAPIGPVQVEVRWPGHVLSRDAAGALSSVVRLVLPAEVVNRTGADALSCVDQTLVETLEPMRDIARMELG